MRYVLLLLASFAYAAPVTLPQDVNFTDGATSWEWQEVGIEAGLNINDATFKSKSHAFDNTAYVIIGSETYTPSNSADLSDVTVNSQVIGKVLTTETKVYSGLNVTNQYLFYSKIKQNSALFIQLVRFENTGSSSISVPIAFYGNLGSDSSNIRLGSSNGVFNLKTAWAVAGNSNTTPGDAVIGHACRVASCVATRPQLAVLAGDNVVQVFELVVPAGQTRFLANFFQLTDTNLVDGLAAAAVEYLAPKRLLKPQGFLQI
jgi:hypothetical protein